MSKGIELSPEHGVNPTIPVCFFCGEEKNEIVLLGRVRKRDPHTGKAVRGTDIEAPRHMVLDYEPCDKCKAIFDQGVTLIGVVTTQPSDGRPPLTAQGGVEVYPTGTHCVVTERAAQKVFENPELKRGQKLFVEQDLLEHMMPEA